LGGESGAGGQGWLGTVPVVGGDTVEVAGGHSGCGFTGDGVGVAGCGLSGDGG
jgi:hypothetical protein